MHRRISACTVFIIVCLSVSACSDDAPTSLERTPVSISASQLDGATGGNPHFYFLRPIAVRNPSFTGTFNPKLYPTIEICDGTAQDADGHCASLLASFRMDGGVNNGGELISVPNGEQMYKTQWRTGGLNVPVDKSLRVAVLLGDFIAGYVDVVKGSDGKFRDAETGTEISGNSTLPIKFRIERGVICGDAAGCVEEAVWQGGGLVALQQIDDVVAGADFPDGALNAPVNVIIQQLDEGECLPTDLPQYRACYHFTTQPKVANFEFPVDVGVCLLDAAAVPFYNDGQLRLWKWSEKDGDPLLELERTTIDFLDCPDLSSLGFRSSSPLLRGLARAGSAVFSPVAALIGPRELQAAGYQGGKLSNFSRVGWVRPLDLEIVQGNNQTGAAGATLPVNPTVRVKNRYGITSQDVAGFDVGFTPSPDGSASPASATSGSNGQAATAWTLASVAGANTLLARVATTRPNAAAPYEAEVTFNANGASAVAVVFLPPLVSKGRTVANTLGLAPVVTITKVGGPTLASMNAVESSSHYAASWDVPALAPSEIYRLAVSVGGVDRGEVLLVQVNNELRNVTTGDKVLNLKNSRTLPIKFVLTR